MTSPHVEINGLPADAENLRIPALTGNYGHFTAMQVRGGRVRGLALHLARLDAATVELFGPGLDGERVRTLIRRALAGAGAEDAAVRVYVYGPDEEPAVMVTVRPPIDLSPEPQHLLSVPYERPVAHLKHLGGFAQRYYGRAAVHQGYTDALLTGPGGEIAEGAVTNIAFWDGNTVVWPDRPALRGITMALVEERLPRYGTATARRPVTLGGLGAYRAAFVTNSQGIAPVARIDDTAFAVDTELMETLGRLYAEVPWDAV
ncbi:MULTISPECIES: aminotransferase class IV family protein [unclassified Streptomyces]|uniref:aminotransferase class IV family protein n=1 Tax=unclassified Streptomyces TaxID=2593676 RepID=UPI0033DF5755